LKFVSLNDKGNETRLFGLDLVRAFAILFVVLYHLNIPGFFNAGFLGVDMFFCLSGYLITSLLIKEFDKNSSIRFVAFYKRRLVRLYPALLVFVFSLIIFVTLFQSQAQSRMLIDLASAIFYYANWHQIFSKQTYFESFASQPVFQHLWSLALEVQYYLFWPVIATLLLRLYTSKSIFYAGLGLAALSTLLMISAYSEGMGQDGLSAIYLATHTHSMGLFIGSAFATLCNPFQNIDHRVGMFEFKNRLALSLYTLIAITFICYFGDESSAFLYCGGFFLFSLLCSVLIVSVATLDSDWPNVGAHSNKISELLNWIGTRSYSIYLWHWPIFVFLLDKKRTDLFRIFIALALLAVISELSYRFVEQYFLKIRLTWSRKLLPLFVIFAFSLVVIYQTDPLAVETPSAGIKDKSAISQADVNQPLQSNPEPTTAPSTTNADEPLKSVVSNSRSFNSSLKILAIGDSVLLGAQQQIVRTIPASWVVDAEVGRQASQGIEVLKKHVGSNNPFNYAVIHLGTNGYIYEKHLRQLLAMLNNCEKVILINDYAYRRWTDSNNELLGRIATEFPNVTLVNWNTIGTNNPQYFVKDGVHLNNLGIKALTEQIQIALGLDPAEILRFNTNQKLSKPQNIPNKKSINLGDSETIAPSESISNAPNNSKHADPAAILNENMSLGAPTPNSPTSSGASHNE
jgi:peptidoglycan/LPS O-acetylase OafA/YrhL